MKGTVEELYEVCESGRAVEKSQRMVDGSDAVQRYRESRSTSDRHGRRRCEVWKHDVLAGELAGAGGEDGGIEEVKAEAEVRSVSDIERGREKHCRRLKWRLW